MPTPFAAPDLRISPPLPAVPATLNASAGCSLVARTACNSHGRRLTEQYCGPDSTVLCRPESKGDTIDRHGLHSTF